MFWRDNIFTPINTPQPKCIYEGIEISSMLTIFKKNGKFNSQFGVSFDRLSD
jgi:hypothetical protein